MAVKHVLNSYKLIVCYYCLLSMDVGVVNGFAPAIIESTTTSSKCGTISVPPEDYQLMEMIKQQLSFPGCNPPKNRSCQEILHCFPSALSGFYQIHISNGSLVQVYCDMEGTNCGNIAGWARVAHVNMTQADETCPQGLAQKNFSEIIVCGRSNSHGCSGTTFSLFGLTYSRVCGQLQGYQFGGTDAFAPYIISNTNINNPYVDGVSITYGHSPRKHVWTYAVGAVTVQTNEPHCPCNTGSTFQPPPFVGNDYYCESAVRTAMCCPNELIADDIMWGWTAVY